MTERGALAALRRLPFKERVQIWGEARRFVFGWCSRDAGPGARSIARRFEIWRRMRLRESMRGGGR